jgi:DNA-binding HxlR family transcriptional regulator
LSSIVGVSEKVVVRQLHGLRTGGIFERTDHLEIPSLVESAVIEFGLGLAKH